MFGGTLKAPYDDGCIQAPTSHEFVIWRPGHTVYLRVVEAPFTFMSQLEINQLCNHFLDSKCKIIT